MHIYAFGSVCRGEIDLGSDVDMLACVDEDEPTVDTQQFSVYTYDKLRDLWDVGNPFVWHLHLESKLVFSSDGRNYLAELGAPASYSEIKADLAKFIELFEGASSALVNEETNAVFNVSCIFLAVRNAAMCYSIYSGKPEFSRYSALNIEPALPVSNDAYKILVRARLLSSRGYGSLISKQEIATVVSAVEAIRAWLGHLEESTNEA
ncbi:nucleotidyltransferase domain-containing protein [Pseudomonas sp. CDFA 602]|uniref:nucleotidyltransferase domain-containing protein n=1 Tax=Pseudomonas californiensis TaxID=2829823 RepID=UPI001E415453|nr:nucleotidyltransferase domain-containing protein [Pseudomonas californiensis]MCD5997292.1 nucleotidyltransferase domain-containing protein [Pseudomonas californiensis]MCD6002892.1 nucleotidyltransferase domain-containing protein [Pseudomonas californiensis]